MAILIKTHKTLSLVAAGLLIASHSALGAPTISNLSGNLSHNSELTISGSGFGTKSQAAPLVWDDASGTNILDKWDDVWPRSGTNPAYVPSYTTPVRGTSLPHNNITKYIAGAHGDNVDAYRGPNVFLIKEHPVTSYPAYTYASWYQRSDDNWTFCGDNNYKVFATSPSERSPYIAPYWYIEYNRRPTSTTNTPAWHIMHLPDGDTENWWADSAVNPMSGVWSKIEIQIKYTDQSNGYIKVRENGVERMNYNGTTASGSLGLRNEGIGGFVRCAGYSNNWRYFADVYLDNSLARVVLANNVNLSNANIIEPQVPSSWSDNSVKVNINRGRLGNLGTGTYLFVFDARKSVV